MLLRSTGGFGFRLAILRLLRLERLQAETAAHFFTGDSSLPRIALIRFFQQGLELRIETHGNGFHVRALNGLHDRDWSALAGDDDRRMLRVRGELGKQVVGLSDINGLQELDDDPLHGSSHFSPARKTSLPTFTPVAR